MSTTTEAAAPAEFQLHPRNLADIAGNLLSNLFLRNDRDRAKRLYKEIKHGKQPGVGNLTSGESLTLPLRLGLDYSEFRGPFGFPAFQTAVQGLLRNLAAQLKADKPLQTFSSDETGTIAFGVPGVIATQEGQHNVLMMAIEPSREPGRPPGLVLKLMFVDPEQFRQH